MKLKDSIRDGFFYMIYRPGSSILIALIDIFFIIFTGFLTSAVFRTIFEPVTKIILFAMSKTNPPEALGELKDLIPNETALDLLFEDVFVKLTIFFVLLWIVWTLIQAIAWHVAYQMTRQKKELRLRDYMLRFGIINILWFGCIYVVFLIFAKVAFSAKVYAALLTAGIPMGITEIIILFIATLLLVMILFFAPISYVVAYKQKNFFKIIGNVIKSLKTKYFFNILLFYLIIITSISLSGFIQELISHISVSFALFTGLVLDFGLFIMLRLTLTIMLTKKAK